MKQRVNRKTSITDNVIRTILREELKNLATKEELNKFATKEGLKNLEANMDIKLETLERKVDEKAQQYRDEVLTSNDKIAKTLETMREEITIGNFQTSEKLEDHEKRIKHLESAQKS